MAGVVALLVLGTQILDWYWPAVLFIVSLAVGVYRVRRKILSPYRLLQRVDWRLKLHDAVSTAYYFEDPAHGGRVPEPIRQAQHEWRWPLW